MSYSQQDLEREISEVIDKAIDQANIVSTKWLTQLILSKHSDIEGRDTPFHTLCAFEHVRDSVRKVTRKFRVSLSVATDRQLLMDGFERLQVAYDVEHEGEQFVVPIRRILRSQMVGKALEIQSQVDGGAHHVREIWRYIELRDKAGDWPPEDQHRPRPPYKRPPHGTAHP